MGNINILDFAVANLIAAGEVVDRPSSVIKELLENSLDAKATVVTVETKRGGSAFMRVTDNGIGMSREDVPICVKRHATSKIKEAHDLDGILTLGFRGEALAAIAAVSKVRIMTKTKDSALGTLMRCEGGTVLEVSETGCPDGTTVIVEELFASVPARRKFLKRDLVETMAIAAVVEKIALSRPDVSIRLICDGTTKFSSAGDGGLKNTIYSVLGRDFANKLIEVDCLTEGIGVNGFIGSPDNVRGNRNLQNFFINGRFVKSKTVQAALEQAFESYIPGDRFPCCVLYLQIHPAYVDVNVHPAKLEVKFSNEQTVFNAVYCGVRNALTTNIRRPSMRFGRKLDEDETIDAETVEKADSDAKLVNAFVPIREKGETPKPDSPPELPEAVPTMTLPDPITEEKIRVTAYNPPEGLYMTSSGDMPEIPDAEPDAPIVREKPDTIKVKVDIPMPTSEKAYATMSAILEKAASVTAETTEPEPMSASPTEESEEFDETPTPPEPQKPPKYRIAGEFFNTYVIVELYDKILLVDKHAAHERILFEEMKKAHESGQIFSQIALVPIELDIEASEYAALDSYKDDIAATGFEFELTESKVSITSYPSEFDIRYVGDMLLSMASKLAEGVGSAETERRSNYEKAMYQAACKAAIKAGDINAPEQIRWICDRLVKLPDIKYCPHGRPVAIELTRNEIERQFGRIK